MKVKVLIAGREEYKDSYPSSLSLWKGDRTFTHTNKEPFSSWRQLWKKQEQGVSAPFQLYYGVLNSHKGLTAPLVISEIANEKYNLNEYFFIPLQLARFDLFRSRTGFGGRMNCLVVVIRHLPEVGLIAYSQQELKDNSQGQDWMNNQRLSDSLWSQEPLVQFIWLLSFLSIFNLP